MPHSVMILHDCHQWLYARYSRVDVSKRTSIPETEIGTWLENKVPHPEIPDIIMELEKTGRMRPGGFKGTWIPNPLFEDDLTYPATFIPIPSLDNLAAEIRAIKARLTRLEQLPKVAK